MLKWNQKKVQQLSPVEIWLFIIGRVLIAFGIGVFAVQYFPEIANTLALPAIIIGLVVMVIALKGFANKKQNDSSAA